MCMYEMVKNAVAERLGEEYEVFYNKVTKNNGVVLNGITVKHKDECLAPTIYVTEEQIRERGIAEVAGYVIEQYEEHKGGCQIDTKDLTSKQYILDNVEYRLIGAETNREKLANCPHTDLLDMSALYVVMVRTNIDETASYTLTNEHIVAMNISKEELDEAARDNTARKAGVQVTSITDLMNEMMLGITAERITVEDMDLEEPGFYVVSNRRKLHGATLLMYSELLEQIANKLDSDLFIIPSSIHEILVMKVNDEVNVEDLKAMVTQVNGTEVSPDEILTDSVYRYGRENGLQKVA